MEELGNCEECGTKVIRSDRLCAECKLRLSTEPVEMAERGKSEQLPTHKYSLNGVLWLLVHVFSNFKIGDHVSYLEKAYYHHAIVEDLDQQEQTLKLIRWSLGNPREIIRCQIKMEFGRYFPYQVYRADYTKGGCYDGDLVVKRARARIGETDYSIITNFARGFADWCKTGKGRLTYSSVDADNRYLRSFNA